METYILHLETATKVCSVALSKNGELIGLRESSDEQYSHGEDLNLFVDDLLKKCNIKMAELSAVSISSGPGSFTGLRIGAATAKAFCYSLDIPLITIDALSSLCELAKAKHPHSNLCALIDARRMEVYNLICDSTGHHLKDISADIIDEHSYSNFEPFVYFGDGASKLEESWQGRNCTIDDTIKSSATGQLQPAYDKWLNKDFEDVAYWEPYYLKDFIVGKKK